VRLGIVPENASVIRQSVVLDPVIDRVPVLALALIAPARAFFCSTPLQCDVRVAHEALANVIPTMVQMFETPACVKELLAIRIGFALVIVKVVKGVFSRILRRIRQL